ncbi:MAG: PspC domain-containing protein [Candidatus Woesebacteria bacterium]|jgi:phage shock protein PspC (stress-responsive transcriptional regulator)
MPKVKSSRKTTSPRKRLYRPSTNKIIAGVAAGLGEYFEIDATLIRLIFIVATFFGGSGVILYLLAWLFLPSNTDLKKSNEAVMKSNLDEMKIQLQTFAKDFDFTHKKQSKKKKKNWLGLILIVLGLFFLLDSFNLINFGQLWPLPIIAIGLLILFKG